MKPLINKVPRLETSLITNYFDNLAGRCVIFTVLWTEGDFVSWAFYSVFKIFTCWWNCNESDRIWKHTMMCNSTLHLAQETMCFFLFFVFINVEDIALFFYINLLIYFLFWLRWVFIVAHGLWSAGSVVVAHGLSCSAACGIFPDQGSNPCPLHWQADS